MIFKSQGFWYSNSIIDLWVSECCLVMAFVVWQLMAVLHSTPPSGYYDCAGEVVCVETPTVVDLKLVLGYWIPNLLFSSVALATWRRSRDLTGYRTSLLWVCVYLIPVAMMLSNWQGRWLATWCGGLLSWQNSKLWCGQWLIWWSIKRMS